MQLAIVYGALRSGSTMFRLMLNGHSQIGSSGEHDYLFDHLYEDADGWLFDLEALTEDRIFRAQNLTPPPDPRLTSAMPFLLD